MDRLGHDIFSALRMKGHVLHRARAHLKVPCWSLVWNALLTNKLAKFLSRLNEEGVLFWEHLRDVEKDDKNASKPVARHFKNPGCKNVNKSSEAS